MTSLLELSNIQLKGFFGKIFMLKFFSPNWLQMVQNVKKMVVGLANWLDRPADQIWLATIFQTFYHSKWSKMWKKPVAGFANQLAGQTVHQTEFLPVTVFLRFGLFGVDLETKFSTKILTKKNLWTVIWQSMTSSCAVNFEIFLVKNFPKKWH